MLALLVAVSVLSPWSSWAEGYAEPCRDHACSDDPDGVLGNEELAWDASPGATWYEIGLASTGEPCDSTETTSYLVSGGPCDEINDGSGFIVRACNDAGCSSWSSDAVVILPHACLDARDWDPCLYRDSEDRCQGGHATQCEKPCYDWQPDTDWQRLPERYEPCP